MTQRTHRNTQCDIDDIVTWTSPIRKTGNISAGDTECALLITRCRLNGRIKAVISTDRRNTFVKFLCG